jgi:hypothetical protein
MTYIMVDTEAEGPIPPDYSMVCFGAALVEPALNRTFYGYSVSPPLRYYPASVAVSSALREKACA